MLILKTGFEIEKSLETSNAAQGVVSGHVGGQDMKRVMLVAEHDDLDCAIAALLAAGTCDDLLIRRLKKRKLHLKDQTVQLAPMQMQHAG